MAISWRGPFLERLASRNAYSPTIAEEGSIDGRQ